MAAPQVQWLVADERQPGGPLVAYLVPINFMALPVTPDANYDKAATTKVDPDNGAVGITMASQGVA
jgi:hypothetical protein